jgi:hypothetical protein
MRILPDTRDLINLTERSIPITPEVFRQYLYGHNSEILLSFTNVRELSGPLARGGDFLRVRRLLQSLETMPHMYIKEVTIVAEEIKAAIQAFNNGVEFQNPSVHVTRWDRTLMMPPGQTRSQYDMFIGLRLDEIVYDAFRFMPQTFAPPEQHLPHLKQLLEQDRAALKQGKAPAREHFIRSVQKHATTHGITLPQGREIEFAEWIYANPNRCPGLRLNHETYRQLMGNYDDIPEVGDFSDLAHVTAVPYCEAATLDNRMRDYCSRASRRLGRLGAPDYRQRLYRNLNDLMRRNP